MNRGNKKRQVRDTNHDLEPRRRVEGDAEITAAPASEALPSDSEGSYTTESSDDGDVVEFDAEEEVFEEESAADDDDDDAYAEFRKESDAALGGAFSSVQIAAADGDDADDRGAVAVWRRDQGDAPGPDGRLAYANGAYDCFFQLRTEYPCLSFDVAADGAGPGRTRYPLSLLLVCGTQAATAAANELVLLRAGNLRRTRDDRASDSESEASLLGAYDDENENENEDEDDEDAVNDGEPTVHQRGVPHHGAANRVRGDPAAGAAAHLVAVWSDAGHVQVFDLAGDLRALGDFAGWSREAAAAAAAGRVPAPRLRFCTPSSTHRVEGFGLGWSAVRAHAFASGDCAGALYVWHPAEDGRWRSVASHTAGARSVEEVRWSPTQAEVLITARAGGEVEVWDVRDMRASKLHWRADPTDINVADWNQARQASHLLVTGADSGAVAIWDLRKLASPDPIQRLPWHSKSITSVEFSPHNESVLAVTSDDGQCTLWDLSLERDPSEEQEVIGDLFGRKDLTDIPDQLMFEHQGLTHPKEVHWHPQIPGMVITADYEGLHLFKPMNWRSLMK